MLNPGPDPAQVRARIRLPASDGCPVVVECPDHGPMPWRGLAYRCRHCAAQVTEADMMRVARWIAGERIPEADCGR